MKNSDIDEVVICQIWKSSRDCARRPQYLLLRSCAATQPLVVKSFVLASTVEEHKGNKRERERWYSYSLL